MAVEQTQSLPQAVAASAEAKVSVLLARASLLGLPRNASRAFVFGCGSGHSTAALGYHLGSAVGIDPSADLVSAANLLFGSRPHLEFAVGGVEALTAGHGRFDLVYADLAARPLVKPRETTDAVAALVSALSFDGIAAIRVPLRRAWLGRGGWANVVTGVALAGGRVLWTSRREEDGIWLFATGRPRDLRVLTPKGEIDPSIMG